MGRARCATGFLDAALLVETQEQYGVDLFGPTRLDYRWQAREQTGFAATEFQIDWEQHQATCPKGAHADLAWRSDHDSITPHLDREGIVNLLGRLDGSARLWHPERPVGALGLVLGCQLHPSYYIPSLHSAGAFGMLLLRFEPMAPRAEVLANRSEGCKEALGVTC